MSWGPTWKGEERKGGRSNRTGIGNCLTQTVSNYLYDLTRCGVWHPGPLAGGAGGLGARSERGAWGLVERCKAALGPGVRQLLGTDEEPTRNRLGTD